MGSPSLQGTLMVVGSISIDPRRVVDAEINYKGGAYWLTVEHLIGDSLRQSETYFDTKEDAEAALRKIDSMAYKTILADAIADKTLDEESDDDEEERNRIGFK